MSALPQRGTVSERAKGLVALAMVPISGIEIWAETGDFFGDRLLVKDYVGSECDCFWLARRGPEFR